MLAIHWRTNRVLSRRYRSVPTATAAEEELTRLLTGGYVTVDRLAGLLRQRKLDGLASSFLAHSRTIDSVTMRSNVLHP
jgi:hypothetical protein